MTVAEAVLTKLATLSPEDQHKVLEFVSALPSEPAAAKSVWQKLSELGRSREGRSTTLPDDLAENHDHYLHGQPKRI
jgi:hypothetical protein